MEIIDRLVQVKCSAKGEEDFLTYTPSDIVFLFGDVIRPVVLIVNHDDPSECFVLFPSSAQMQDIDSLIESPSWVGAHMQLIIKKPCLSILPIVTKLLADKGLEEGGGVWIYPNWTSWTQRCWRSWEIFYSQKRGGTCCHCLGQTVKIPEVTGT